MICPTYPTANDLKGIINIVSENERLKKEIKWEIFEGYHFLLEKNKTKQ